ncbi:hypothetical protein AQUCO_03700101v1 [Aquilegia coerulea]|uniref:F-box domain-containing protein n=1 Tax=Aquilegia coerulea TaxID=218851 RepID=A0A2G5CTI3_AQUCA|nr:hypothetical protein AQUCO_03700101v1 [Aquilegia coerulea]
MNPSLTMKKSEKKKSSQEDRISDLSDELIHHIFSFLDMKDVVHTSILSNRWKTLWLSTPNLNFFLLLCHDCMDHTLDDGDLCDSCLKKKRNFKDFIDRVLLLRGNYRIDKFNLYCTDSDVDTARLHTWILSLLDRKVQQLILEVVIYYKTWELPHKLFTSNISVLKLCCEDFYNARARLPISICTAERIKILELNSVMFPDGIGYGGELILSCPVLETLKIARCDLSNIKVLTVSTPQLQRLKFVSLYTNRNKSCRVRTCTPNLKTIEVIIYTHELNSMLDYCLENLTSLASAQIGFYSYTDPNFIPRKYYPNLLVKILSGIHNVQSLKLLGRCLQLLTGFPKAFNKLSDIFSNLKCVMLEKPESPYDQAVVKLLFGEDVQWRIERGDAYFTSYQQS